MEKKIRQLLGLPIKTPIEYWRKYWQYYIERLEDKKEHEIGPTGSRLVIESIISEITYNDLANEKNTKFFRKEIENWTKRDEAFNELYGDKVKLIRERFNSEYKDYILVICQEIIEDMNKGTYFEKLADVLISYLKKKVIDIKTKSSINLYTELMITEFISSGFAIGSLYGIQNHPIDIATVTGGDVEWAPNIYRELRRDDFKDNEAYYDAIKKRLQSRTIEEIIEEVKNYFHKEESDFTVLIGISGIRGDIDVTIGNINLYSPTRKRYIDDEYSLFGLESQGDKNKNVIAAIPIHHKDGFSAIDYACRDLNAMLGCMTLLFSPSVPYKYDKSEIAVVNNGFVVASKSIGYHDVHHELDRKILIDDELSTSANEIGNNIDEINELFSIKQSDEKTWRQLSTAIFWYKKGCETEIPEDKLLFSWIALEGVLSIDSQTANMITQQTKSYKIDVIQKICKSILIPQVFYNSWYNMYIRLYTSIFDYDNFYDLSENAIKKTGLDKKVGEIINRADFINNITNFENDVNDEILKNELHHLNLLYRNQDEIKEMSQKLYGDILLIYRLRNLIVHNAVYPHNIIGIYARKALYICGKVLNNLQFEYAQSSMDMKFLLLSISAKYDEFGMTIDKIIREIKTKKKELFVI